MRIIHCADIHISPAMQNLPADKAKLRKRETIDSFIKMIDLAKGKNVSVVIIAGDFFDVGKVARSTRKEILDIISDAPDISFLYLVGNHDHRLLLEADDLPLPDNLLRFDAMSDWTYFNYDNVCIAGIDILKQNGYGFYEKLDFDKNKFNIAVLHGDLKTIQLDRLKGKNIDYLALGDIHLPDMDPKKLDSRGVYAYSGCLDGHGYDEAGEKGFFLLDIENDRFKREFYSVAKRRYEIVELDITGLDTHSKIDAALKSKTDPIPRENIVKAVLTGKRRADTQIEKDNIEIKLIDQFFYAKVKDESRLDMDSVALGNETSLRSEFARLVKESGLPEEQKEKIIEYGIKALCGEVIDL